MKFACDSCHAQYLISDDKVGPNGVIVRCKKCQHKIIVRRSTEPAAPPPPAPQVETQVAPSAPPPAAASEPPVPEAPPMAAAPPPPPVDEPAPPMAFSAPPVAPSSYSAPPPNDELGGFDDELGRAFDSVLARPGGAGDASSAENAKTDPGGADARALAMAAASAGPSSQETDRLSTKVVDLAPMANLIKADAALERRNGAGVQESERFGSETPAPTGAPEWFVAINDVQNGPLTLDGVRGHWDKGELSGDSLVWRAGMPDWRPLSSVPELADALAPTPGPALEKPEAPAGALATGVQAPAAATLPPPQGEPSESGWKPSTGSALESLVQQELEALQKPPEKKPEPPPAEALPPPARGLVDEVPPPAEDLDRASAPTQVERPAGRRPASAALAREESEPESTTGLTPVTRHIGLPSAARSRPPVEERVSAGTPLPERKRRSSLPIIVLSMAILVLAAGVVGGAYLLSRNQTPPAVVAQAAPAPAPASAAPASAAPAPAQPAAASAAPAPAAAAPPAASAEAQPGAAAAPPAPPAASATASADAPAPRAAAPVAHPAAAAAPKHAAAGPKAAVPPPPPPQVVASAKEPETVIEAAKPKAAAGSNVDEEFNRLFGGGGAPAAPDAAAKKDKPKATPYIPPPPGGGASPAKETLGQGDIMEVVLANKPQIKKCTEAAGTSGTLTMRWTIRQDGGTANVQTMTPEFQKTPVSACLATVIKGFKFPAYSGAPMAPIDFPFKF